MCGKGHLQNVLTKEMKGMHDDTLLLILFVSITIIDTLNWYMNGEFFFYQMYGELGMYLFANLARFLQLRGYTRCSTEDFF